MEGEGACEGRPEGLAGWEGGGGAGWDWRIGVEVLDLMRWVRLSSEYGTMLEGVATGGAPPGPGVSAVRAVDAVGG
eukprot:3323848-Rhodomonas_salina.1